MIMDSHRRGGNKLPCINDYVNYKTQGVCKIEDLRPMKFDPDSREREYYILRPVHQDSFRIFVPADNQTLIDQMRPVLSPEEIDRIILSVKDQSLTWEKDRKARSARFQEILSRRDERELLMLISCLYLKSKETANGLSSTDTQILKKAELIIEQEFAFSLKISMQSVGIYIRKKLDMADIPAG